MHPVLNRMPHSAPGVAAVLARYGGAAHALVQVLRELQAQFGWLPRETLGQVGDAMGLTLAHVEGVAAVSLMAHKVLLWQVRGGSDQRSRDYPQPAGLMFIIQPMPNLSRSSP